MTWPGHLALNYRRADSRSVLHDRHSGPLRVLRSLYPEGEGICHNVLVHPPGGIVGGDALRLEAVLAEGTHALITTPGATRFYRSAGEPASQSLVARLATGARLEWLPLESIVHSGALAENRMRFELAPQACMIGWDVLALGLPASNLAFERGSFTQHIELPGAWLEHARIAGHDTRLLDSPAGWAGHRVLGTIWIASGSDFGRTQRDALLDAARARAAGHALERTAGATSPHAGVVLLRVLAHRVEPAMDLLTRVWQRWREQAWGLPACPPRVWRS